MTSAPCDTDPLTPKKPRKRKEAIDAVAAGTERRTDSYLPRILLRGVTSTGQTTLIRTATIALVLSVAALLIIVGFFSWRSGDLFGALKLYIWEPGWVETTLRGNRWRRILAALLAVSTLPFIYAYTVLTSMQLGRHTALIHSNLDARSAMAKLSWTPFLAGWFHAFSSAIVLRSALSPDSVHRVLGWARVIFSSATIGIGLLCLIVNYVVRFTITRRDLDPQATSSSSH